MGNVFCSSRSLNRLINTFYSHILGLKRPLEKNNKTPTNAIILWKCWLLPKLRWSKKWFRGAPPKKFFDPNTKLAKGFPKKFSGQYRPSLDSELAICENIPFFDQKSAVGEIEVVENAHSGCGWPKKISAWTTNMHKSSQKNFQIHTISRKWLLKFSRGGRPFPPLEMKSSI